jgi:hypothetical protein
MVLNVTEPILDYKNEPIKEGERNANWRDVIFNALNSQVPGENLTTDQKVKAYQVTKKTFNADTPEFSVEECAFILERIKAVYAMPLIIGRALELFDGSK